MEENKAGFSMSLYDINEQLIRQIEDVDEPISYLQWVLDDWDEYADHWMLLCKEISYYTIIEYKVGGECGSLAQAIWECLEFYGKVKTANVSNNQMEIWVYDKKVDQMNCFHFFPADDFVVTVDTL